MFFYVYCAEWLPSLWIDTFDELLNDDNELDYGDQWSLNFNYTQTDQVTKEERKRGWKVYCHCAYGKYVLFNILKISRYITINWNTFRSKWIKHYSLIRWLDTLRHTQTCKFMPGHMMKLFVKEEVMCFIKTVSFCGKCWYCTLDKDSTSSWFMATQKTPDVI